MNKSIGLNFFLKKVLLDGDSYGYKVSQAIIEKTNNAMDIAIDGEGYIPVVSPDGEIQYTRDGSFKVDSTGQLVNSNGLRVMPEIILPEGYDVSTLNVTQSGVVSVKVNGANDPVEVGQLELYRFPNAVGLQAEGDNLFIVTNASGDAIAGRPGYEGFGDVRHKFLEMSNVSVVNEMVQMITAQRAYEFNSKTIQTSDNMLSTAVNLKR